MSHFIRKGSYRILFLKTIRILVAVDKIQVRRKKSISLESMAGERSRSHGADKNDHVLSLDETIV